MLPEKQIIFLYRALGDRIKGLRKKSGYNQTKFAELLDISRASLVNIEKGRQRPPLHIIYAIADLLQIDINNILPMKMDFESKPIEKKILNNIKKTSGGDESIEKALEGFIGVTKKSYE